VRLLFCSAAGLIAAEGKATRADEIRMNANVAEYHVPVNADVHDIEVIFVDEPDASIRSASKGWARSASSVSRRETALARAPSTCCGHAIAATTSTFLTRTSLSDGISVPKDALKLIKGMPRPCWSNSVARLFCETCGMSVFAENSVHPVCGDW